jgi:NADH-quinone oxidoreductase subunit J
MEFKQIVFYAFAAIMLFAATMVITVRNPVKAALSLVLTFVSASGLWFLLQAEFLAIALVLVYVGAVMVLFLFVVMMLDINIARVREGFAEYLPYGGLIAVLLVIEMALIISSGHFSAERLPEPASLPADHSNTRELGRLLYTQYAYPFEIAALILLVAIVAAIALTLRKRKSTKYQDPSAQINIKREDRVRVIKMPPENRS